MSTISRTRPAKDMLLRHLTFATVIVLSAAILSGCAQSRKVPSAGTTPDNASSETLRSSESAGKAAAGQENEPVQETAIPKPDLAPIDDDPGQLIKMTRDDLNGLLGQPDLVRRENPAEIWQYRGKGCILDVFLYSEDDRTDSPYRVVYSEARDRVAGKTDQRTCLNELLRAQLTS